jgi:hypothetical protein
MVDSGTTLEPIGDRPFDAQINDVASAERGNKCKAAGDNSRDRRQMQRRPCWARSVVQSLVL